MGYVQVLCRFILYKGLEHPWMLVSVRDLEPIWLRIPRDECMCIM